MKAKQVIGLCIGFIFGMLIMGIMVYNISSSLAARPPALPAATVISTATRVAPVVAGTPPVITPEVTPIMESTPPVITPVAPAGEAAPPAQIPLCTFAAQAPITPATSSLDAYTFSEPGVVITSATEMVLLQWVSETQSLLLRSHPRADSPKRIIETFNPQTGAWQRYAEAQLANTEPIWIATASGVLFVERLPDGQQVLRLSQGIAQPLIDLVVDVPSGAWGVDSTRQQVLLLARTPEQQLQMARISYAEPWHTVTALEAVSVGLQGRYGMTLSPDGAHAAIYGREGFYLREQATGQLCRFDLGRVGQAVRWGGRVQWSDDGRYMALITTYGVREGEMLRVMDLTVVDMTTGQPRQIDFGIRHAYHIYWLPDTYVFLITVDDKNEPRNGFKNLYLVNAITGEVKDILPDHRFLANHLGLRWTAREKTIFVSCSQATDLGASYDESRICAIAVEVQ